MADIKNPIITVGLAGAVLLGGLIGSAITPEKTAVISEYDKKMDSLKLSHRQRDTVLSEAVDSLVTVPIKDTTGKIIGSEKITVTIKPRLVKNVDDRFVLEVEPGDSLFSRLMLRRKGADTMVFLGVYTPIDNRYYCQYNNTTGR